MGNTNYGSSSNNNTEQPFVSHSMSSGVARSSRARGVTRSSSDEEAMSALLQTLIRGGHLRVITGDSRAPADDSDLSDDEARPWTHMSDSPIEVGTSSHDAQAIRNNDLFVELSKTREFAYSPVYHQLRLREQAFSKSLNFTKTQRAHICGSYFLPNEMKTIAKHRSKVFCGQYSSDGCHFVSACQDKKIRYYSTIPSKDGKFQILQTVSAQDVGWSIIDVALTPQTQKVLYSSWSHKIYMTDLVDEGECSSPRAHQALHLHPAESRFCVFSLKVSNDGREVLAGASDKCLYVYDMECNRRVSQIEGHEDDVNAVAFADPSSYIVFSGGDDGLLKTYVFDHRSDNAAEKAYIEDSSDSESETPKSPEHPMGDGSDSEDMPLASLRQDSPRRFGCPPATVISQPVARKKMLDSDSSYVPSADEAEKPKTPPKVHDTSAAPQPTAATVDSSTDSEVAGPKPKRLRRNCVKFLEGLPNCVKKVTFYADCCAVNRNQYVSIALLHKVANSEFLEEIEQKFLESGHTQMEVDSMHSAIEIAKKGQKINVPMEWEVVLRSARRSKPYEIENLTKDNVFDLKKLAIETGKLPAKNTDKEKINWMKTKWFSYRKGSASSIFYKESFSDQEPFKEMKIVQVATRRSKSAALTPAYSSKIPISAPKKADLLKMVKDGVIRPEYADFYEKLPTASGAKDFILEEEEDVD